MGSLACLVFISVRHSARRGRWLRLKNFHVPSHTSLSAIYRMHSRDEINILEILEVIRSICRILRLHQIV